MPGSEYLFNIIIIKFIAITTMQKTNLRLN